MLTNGASNFLHYLENFLFVGPAADDTTGVSLQRALDMCTQISFPVSNHKTVWPTHKLTFLGIEIDTIAGTMSLPIEKMQKIQELLATWVDRKAAPKRDLLSPLGHASTVVRPGRTFVRHLIDATTQASAPHHYVRLNTSAEQISCGG